MPAATLPLLLLAATATAQVTPSVVPTIISTFCDVNRDTQYDGAGKILQDLNYTLCMDVKSKSYSLTCIQGTPCPPGPNVQTSIYTGANTIYNLDWTGKCTKQTCAPAGSCDPPDGMPFEFILLDNDARGMATRIGTAEIDGLAVDHYQHIRGPGMQMNWYLLRGM